MKQILLSEYYAQWIKIYKEGAIRSVTLKKYYLALSWIRKLAPNLFIHNLNRLIYQQLLNDFAATHEKQTTMDFHRLLKPAIQDALDEGFIEKDPCRKVIIKGKVPRPKKAKYLNQFELHSLLKTLKLGEKPNVDWMILLIAKTGMRFSEAAALTPADFDFSKQIVVVNKTWDYKEARDFQPTKNKSSIRKIQIDWMISTQFSALTKNLPADQPIFIKENIYNSTVNDTLERRCKQANVPIISVHGLRHTHASVLLYAGVSIASVAQRLGHSNMSTTQKVYLHIINELENKDIDLVMKSLSALT
ncbi:site-specific integrase [Mycoplasma seminis]|uniref:Site-specific integrase n=1 Tax=Mycoplasma seminis TaxID=512749 RepID=A0ABY9HBX8_9MOLU|nr:site-specific integrase [Mycoplasma seminis]WLP85695.1 site-specific integrase [Mycoplasma seminis]